MISRNKKVFQLYERADLPVLSERVSLLEDIAKPLVLFFIQIVHPQKYSGKMMKKNSGRLRNMETVITNGIQISKSRFIVSRNQSFLSSGTIYPLPNIHKG